MRPYSPGGLLIVLTPAQKGSIPPTPSNHRLRHGLPGYLILFAPHAFVPQCQLQSSKPPSPLVFLLISTHFTATLGIPLTSPPLKKCSFKCSLPVKPIDFTSDLHPRLPPGYPWQSPQSARPNRWLLGIGVALVAGLNPTSHDTS